MRGGIIFWLIVSLGLSLGLIAYLLDLPRSPEYAVTAAQQFVPVIPCQAPVLPDDACDDIADPAQRDRCKGRRRI